MEELTARRNGDGPRSRGQLLLVAAIAMAVIFLALGVITNAAIFTQNLASRGDTAGSGDALTLRGEIQSSIAEMVTEISRTDGSPEPVALSLWVGDFDDVVSFQAGASSTLVQVDYQSQFNGVFIEDVDTSSSPPYSDFSSADGSGDWTIVNGNDNVRAFEVEIDRDSLLDPEDHFKDDTLDEFHVTFASPDDSGSRDPFWRIQIGERGGSDVGINVTRNDLSNPGSVHVGTCTVTTSSSFTVNVTASTVDGERCDALAKLWRGPNKLGGSGYFDGSFYEINVTNGGEVDGTFEFVADGVIADSTDYGTRSSDDPWNNDAVYFTTVEYRYNGTSMGYRDVIRVAPGEPDDD